jgi:hypothetical protein
MGAGDTTDYIRQHLKFAGRSDPLFSDDAIHAIHLASRGYPRAVNNLAVAALIATYAADKAIVDLAAAQSAITENSEWTRVTTDDHHVTIPMKAPPESTGGAFSCPTIVTEDDAAIVI